MKSKMKAFKTSRVILSIVIAWVYLPVLSQSQPGYVKTLGRPNQKGMPLSGVMIRAKGSHNTVMSGLDGKFTLAMAGKQEGEAYILQQVQKVGFELSDISMVGRTYAFSSSTPLTIVMISTKQLQADKQRIESNAYAIAAKNYKEKMNKLEHQKAENEITIEQYRESIQDLHNQFERYQSMIDGIAEHYAHTDYDEMDEKEREINLCIENGDLDRADSLIHGLFDPSYVLKKNKENIAIIGQRLTKAQHLKEKAQLDLVDFLKRQEKDANYLFELYTISLAKFDNKKAQFYIETRAELDTTNIKWQTEAGLFMQFYMADYNKAYSYHKRTLTLSLAQEGEESLTTADVYNNIATVKELLGDYNSSMLLFKKSADIKRKLLGENSLELASSLINIGELLSVMEDYENSIDHTLNGVNILKNSYGENHPDVATCYNNLAVSYVGLNDYDKAYNYLKKTLDIKLSLYDKDNLKIADSYNNMGLVLYKRKDYKQSLSYYNHALKIWKSALGESHPNIATCISNIGAVYEEMRDSINAISNYFSALDIRRKSLGDNHIKVAQSYNAIGEFYYGRYDYQKALDYVLTALKIRIITEGKEHPDVALSYFNIGILYYGLGNSELSLSYLQKSYYLYNELYGAEHPSAIEVLNTIKKIKEE